MTTLAHAMSRDYANDWENCYPSAVLSGIVGDLAHKLNGGYHISIEDQRVTNYSVIRPKDKAPPGKWSRRHASAVDMSMSTPDMVRDWNRVYAVWKDHSDPRRIYFNAYNGWNGTGDAERLDFVTNTRANSTSDHKWHAHEEGPRCYVDVPWAYDARLSVHKGETKAQYIARTETQPSSPSSEEDNVEKVFVRGFTTDNGLPADPQQIWLVYEDGRRRPIPVSWFDGGPLGPNKGPITNAQIHASTFLGNVRTNAAWERGGYVFVSGGEAEAWGVKMREPFTQQEIAAIAKSVADGIADGIVIAPGALSAEDRVFIKETSAEGAEKAIRKQFSGVDDEK